MIRGIAQRRIVDDEQDRRNFVRRLGSVAEETQTPIHAWALMSNHARMLRQTTKRMKRHAERVVAVACREKGVSLTELRSGSRRGGAA